MNWKLIVQLSLFGERHPQEAAMLASMPLATHPRVMMLISGPIVGVISGLVLGLLAFLASKVVRRS